MSKHSQDKQLLEILREIHTQCFELEDSILFAKDGPGTQGVNNPDDPPIFRMETSAFYENTSNIKIFLWRKPIRPIHKNKPIKYTTCILRAA